MRTLRPSTQGEGVSWYTSKWWRFAFAPASDPREATVAVIDADGRWVNVVGTLWFLAERGATE